jgi:hypothetical protein
LQAEQQDLKTTQAVAELGDTGVLLLENHLVVELQPKQDYF